MARDGGTLSTGKITARQDGQILLEALASFNEPFDSVDYQQPMPGVADPDALPPGRSSWRRMRTNWAVDWVRSQPFDLRYVDAPPRLALDLAEPSPRLRMWWRPNGSVPAGEALHSCLLTYLSGTTMVEPAIVRASQGREPFAWINLLSAVPASTSHDGYRAPFDNVDGRLVPSHARDTREVSRWVGCGG